MVAIAVIQIYSAALKTLNLKKSPYGLFLAILKNHCGFYNNSVFPTRLLSSYWELKKGKGLRLKSNVHIVYIAFLVKVLTQKNACTIQRPKNWLKADWNSNLAVKVFISLLIIHLLWSIISCKILVKFGFVKKRHLRWF